MPAENEVLAQKLTVSRIVAAPREQVFAAWTDPAQLVQWCYLSGMDNRHTEINPVVGGNWTIAVKSAEGMDILVRREYREISPPSRLVFYELCKAGDRILLDGVHTVEFAEAGGKTQITVSVELKNGFDADNQRGWNWGWNDLFDRLGSFLADKN
jgi:uncharacterized protein YndB with AHSA1/START domain